MIDGLHLLSADAIIKYTRISKRLPYLFSASLHILANAPLDCILRKPSFQRVTKLLSFLVMTEFPPRAHLKPKIYEREKVVEGEKNWLVGGNTHNY